MAMSKGEMNRRWRQKYPEKVRLQRRNYLERKLIKSIKENPVYLDKLKGKLLGEFERLTRIMFDDKLPRRCADCGCFDVSDDLQIHHIRYVFPIVEGDLVRLCRCCHVLEHQRIVRKFVPSDKVE